MHLFDLYFFYSLIAVSQQTLEGDDVEKNKITSAKFGLPSSEFIINDNTPSKPLGIKTQPTSMQILNIDISISY